MKRVFTSLVAACMAAWGVAPSLTAQTEPSDEAVEKSITVEATEVTDNSISVRWTEVEETDVYFITLYDTDIPNYPLMQVQPKADGIAEEGSAPFTWTFSELKPGTSYIVTAEARQDAEDYQTLLLASDTIRVKTPDASTANETIHADDVSITTRAGQIVVQASRAVDVRIYTLSGSCLYAGRSGGCDVYDVPQGVYIVTVGKTVRKVAVR